MTELVGQGKVAQAVVARIHAVSLRIAVQALSIHRYEQNRSQAVRITGSQAQGMAGRSRRVVDRSHLPRVQSKGGEDLARRAADARSISQRPAVGRREVGCSQFASITTAMIVVTALRRTTQRRLA